MKFSLSLRYAFGRFVFEFDKIQMDDDIIVTDIISGPKVQYNKRHLMT